MHKAILFDLGKVLIHFDFRRGYRALEGYCPHAAEEIPHKLAGSGLVERFETGLVEPRDFVAQMCRMLDLRMDYDQFRKVWSSIFTDELIPESMLEGLSKRYRLVLVSNTNALHFEMLSESYQHMLRHFDELVLSHEVRAMKPCSEFYRAALGKAGCEPEECFYADDIPEFVAAARQMGIDGVVFESLTQLEGELRLRGIEWE
ncbi:MAG: HAD family phosphatase [Candidatus Solibacter sp.]